MTAAFLESESVLAEIDPEHADALVERGRNYGHSRLVWRRMLPSASPSSIRQPVASR